MRKKRRRHLRDGDTVVVYNVPDDMSNWRGRKGRIKGVRGIDRTWTVIFNDKPKEEWTVFYRHELRTVRGEKK